METQGKIRFDIVKPDGLVLSEAVDEVIVPGTVGSFGVLPGHAPLLTALGTGEVMYRSGTARRYLAVSGGFCEVKDDKVTLLAELAERAEDVDVARATRAKARAEERLASLRSTHASEEDLATAAGALERATLRLAVAARKS